MFINGTDVYLCDPSKHKTCRKTGCFLNGGPCRLTISKEGQQKMKVVLDEGAYMPERAHPTDAGLDLRTREAFCLWPGHHHTFDTGVHIELPRGKCALLVSKSGLNVLFDVTSTGLIDEGYTGSIVVNLQNHGTQDIVIQRGDKISQFVILDYYAEPLAFVEVDDLGVTERGAAGFGSTGRS